MARVSAHMKRYGVTIDRLERGTVATTDSGSLWVALLAVLSQPERILHLRSLLHHPLLQVDHYFLSKLEPYWYGVVKHRVGQMPKLPESIYVHEAYPVLERFVYTVAQLSRRPLTASAWITVCKELLDLFGTKEGVAHEVFETLLTTLMEADILGELDIREFTSLVAERFDQPVRHGGVAVHPQISMLTPVEARLQQFDRVILASMLDTVWPGIPTPNAWLNLAAQAALGLPSPAHQHSLAAHDILMLASSAEVYFTWPQRDQGSPTTRSRYVERLVTLLAMHGIPESAITASSYAHWADHLYAAEKFAPSTPVTPLPESAQRPRKLPVSALDRLFSDPFWIYARYVLGLKEIDVIDADPQASDFGSLAHKAIQALTQHWNAHNRTATHMELAAMADTALRDFADRPSTALFWRTRLLRALSFVDGLEQERRQAANVTVTAELPVEAVLALSEAESLMLHGRIDRLEQGREGLTIADYKTGDIPNMNAIMKGEATQLLAYAMLVDDTKTLEYWRLPHGKHEGKTLQIPLEQLREQGLTDQLKAALLQMLDASTPFLSMPGRMGHEYDGISRYDEWAG